MFSSRFVGFAVVSLVVMCSIALLLGHLPPFRKNATDGAPGHTVSPQSASHAAITARGPFIAYVTPSRQNRELWLVRPDGSGAQKLWWAPGTAAHDGIGSVTWRPDGRAVTFDSGHAWSQSMGLRDLYTVPLAGGAVLRPTEMPDPSAFSSLPQGSVRVSLNSGAVGQELLIYVQGAAAPVELTASPGQVIEFTIPGVADFGPNVRQYAHVYNKTANYGDNCWDDIAAFFYVHPRATVDVGAPLRSLNSRSCNSLSSPSWRADQRSITYLFRESTTSMLSQPVSLWKINGQPAIGDNGERLLAGETGGGNFYLVAMNPARSSADQFLIVRTELGGNTYLFLSNEQDPSNLERIDLGYCPHLFCKIMGIAWFPSGDGFFFSNLETGGGNIGSSQPAGPDGSYIYAFDLNTHALTEILRIPQDIIGRISASPDGRTLVFERAARFDDSTAGFVAGPRPLCPCSIWVVNRDGSGLKRIVDDGRAPAWSPM